MYNGEQGSPFSGKQGIEEALKRLNAKMVYAGIEPVALVSCGRASLNLMGWDRAPRATWTLLRNHRDTLHRHPHPPCGHPLPSDGRGPG